jgi:hypothetical protein
VLFKVAASTDPAQGNKTVFSYSTELLSAELPAPRWAEETTYDDATLTLRFESIIDRASSARSFYQFLQGLGWESTTRGPVEKVHAHSLSFFHKRRGKLTVEITEGDKGSRTVMSLQTPAELRVLDGLPQTPVVRVKVPAEAKNVRADEGEVYFEVAPNNGYAAAGAIETSLRGAGWTQDPEIIEREGHIKHLMKDDGSIRIVYLDPRVINPASVSVSASGVKLEEE